MNRIAKTEIVLLFQSLWKCESLSPSSVYSNYPVIMVVIVEKTHRSLPHSVNNICQLYKSWYWNPTDVVSVLSISSSRRQIKRCYVLMCSKNGTKTHWDYNLNVFRQLEKICLQDFVSVCEVCTCENPYVHTYHLTNIWYTSYNPKIFSKCLFAFFF